MVGSASTVEMIGLIGVVGGSGTVRAVRAIGAFDVVGTVKSIEAAELLELVRTLDTSLDLPLLCPALVCSGLRCVALRCVALRCTALHCTALPWSPTHCRRAGVRGLAGPLCRMDAAHEPPWMGLRRVPRTHTPPTSPRTVGTDAFEGGVNQQKPAAQAAGFRCCKYLY
ncbi:MAG TPA: hypothetical protein DCX91_07090 [Stenotrophomonas sp.]|nr:hypothetical protein [Stenotrophomonas sp.]